MRNVVAILVLCIAVGFRPGGQEPGGNRAYRGGDYAKAVERYREAMARGRATPQMLYNLGTALLRLGEAELARARLTESLEAQLPELRARAFYNLGNAHATIVGPEAAEAEDLRAAIDAYRRSLLLDSTRDDARWNLELALRRLEQLESSQQSMDRPDQDPSASPEGERGGEREGERGAESESTRPGSGATSLDERADLGSAESPLPKELAEQILRAVEERERGLQREKLRRERRRVRGPDW
jgi:tetratricopeptide (TPR) repeat protein